MQSFLQEIRRKNRRLKREMNILLRLNPHQRKIDQIILQRYVNTTYISALEAMIRRYQIREANQVQAESASENSQAQIMTSSSESSEHEGSQEK